MTDLQNWIGHERRSEDTITPELLRRFEATLTGHIELPEYPVGLHWCLGQPALPSTELGQDGHPAKGGFLPPVPLPRRMWAGGEITIHKALPTGQTIRKVSRIDRITPKQSQNGPLVFVDVAHDLTSEGQPLLSEVQTIVYRSPGPARQTPPAPLPEPRHSLVPDSTLLFRYSALTFNGHRIHYDQAYATGVEGYRGLVVHGPLIATCLANFAGSQNAARLRRFVYRGHAPAFADEALHLSSEGQEVSAHNASGALVMTGRADFAS